MGKGFTGTGRGLSKGIAEREHLGRQGILRGEEMHYFKGKGDKGF
jgi:hypothetical protein